MPCNQSDDASDLLHLYLEDVGRHPLLTKDGEVSLAKAIEAGRRALEILASKDDLTTEYRGTLQHAVRDGNEAELAFITSNLRLVVSIAVRYQGSGLPLLDLVQEGNLGLLHAAEKFDWRKGFKFSTYATWWIRQSISRGIANSGRAIRVPVRSNDLLRLIRRAEEALQESLSRSPTLAEISAATGLSVDKLQEVRSYGFAPVSLSQRIGTDDFTLEDFVDDRSAPSPEDLAVRAMAPRDIARILAGLEWRERLVIRLHFGLGGDEPLLDAVGARRHLSRERVRQIERRALSKLRYPASPAARSFTQHVAG